MMENGSTIRWMERLKANVSLAKAKAHIKATTPAEPFKQKVSWKMT